MGLPITFEKTVNNTVIITKGTEKFGLPSDMIVIPARRYDTIDEYNNLVEITKTGGSFDVEIYIDWRDVTTPTSSSRNDLIVQLMTNFFFRLNTGGGGSGSIPNASTTVVGITRLATPAEVESKLSNSIAVTPYSLGSFLKKYSTPFLIANWTGTNPYTMTIPYSVHKVGLTALSCLAYELNGADYDLVQVDIKTKANGDVVLISNAKFIGQLIIVG